MSGKMRILVRKFEPFENITRGLWEQYRELMGTGLELEMVALPLPGLHAAIHRRNS